MRVTAERVGVRGAQTSLLEPTSLRVETGQLALVCGDGGHTALGLALAGRLRPSTGAVHVEGLSPAVLPKRAALVDSPGVSEPDDALPLRNVVAEELGNAGEPSGRHAVAGWLRERHAAEHATTRMDALPAAIRTGLLAELAAGRPGLELLILDRPDRHIADTTAWWPLAQRLAERLAVVVLCAPNTAALLPIDPARIGQAEQPEPLSVPTETGTTS